MTLDPVFPDSVEEMLSQPCVRLQDHPQSRYGVAHAATGTVPVGQPWRDQPASVEAARKRHYPLFQASSQSQFFNIAVYLHKLQGLMALLAER